MIVDQQSEIYYAAAPLGAAVFLQTGNQARFTAYGAIISRRRLLGWILPDPQQCYDVGVSYLAKC